MPRFETDVVIIGGGATGTSILRDCALRGINAILLEQDDLASGTTGRNHGLLHSGARYAVTDAHSAVECIQENKILKTIARHCVEETDGLYLTLPEDDINFQSTFIDACRKSGISAQRLTREEALRFEPNANPTLLGAVRVPDGTLDPFRLCASNILDAKELGGKVFTHTRVTGLIREQNRVVGVKCYNMHQRQSFEIYAQQVINAAGIWGQGIAEYADLKIKMFPAKGSLLILDYRINNVVLNRCRPPADADILVPGDTISLIGTTSQHIDISEINDLHVTSDEVDTLLEEGTKLAPIMANSRILRAYAGVRPLVAVDDDGSGRNISRGIVLLDHQERDGLEGFVTITGGKLMTCRLMAEMATDMVAKKLGNTTPCETHTRLLPGAAKAPKQSKKTASLAKPVYESAVYRHGERALQFMDGSKASETIICECEMVTAGEIQYAIQSLDVHNLVDLRRRTRLGMGPCQGELCAYRAASLFTQYTDTNAANLLVDFLEERWKGAKPILWGDALRESEYSYWIYETLMGGGEIPAAPIHTQELEPTATTDHTHGCCNKSATQENANAEL
uniref:anaerobic glycerol-3-phosphate dehydrogenase subunit A n=1 Tax=Thaumasiovibrio occultus TaxID=1891184 RepID=UPI000B357436|nr:anaerobic glycerol-3-phosphate dehydrogenase subunit A [Thaumasiovibrio occultus]